MNRWRLNAPLRRVKRMRKTVDYSANYLHFEADMEASDKGRRYYRKTFLTLTYHHGDDWQPGHMGDFTRAVRKWFERAGETFRMAWVAETQSRGAIHYHAILFVPRHLRLPCPDRCGWWPHGMTKVETARNPVGYLTKYASKTGENEAQRFPRGARMHGCCGLSAQRRRWRRTSLAAQWIRAEFRAALGTLGTLDLVKVVGGYMDRATGLLVRSPWRVELDAGGTAWAVSA